MDFDVPTDLINRAQIGFREGVGLSSFDPEETTLPSLPTLEACISTLDSSPSYLRCKFCKGKLLRGLQSLICIYCGENQKKDLHPDPISFNSSNGYRWLLQSLNLSGSISWQDKPKKPENSFDNKTSEHGSSLNVGTADLDSFFIESKRAIVSDASEEQPVTSKNDQNKAFGGQENLTLFQNVLPLETSVISSIDVSGDASSGWNAEFQSADTKIEDENSKSVDPFVGAEADLSVHMDAVFGQIKRLNNTKLNDDSVTAPSTGKDWIPDDLFANMSSATFPQAEQLESVAEAKDGLSGHQNDISSEGIDGDWFNDGIWQTSSANNAAVAQQADLLDLVAKHNEGSSQDKSNDSFTEGVSIDWFENTNWLKSTANNTATDKDENSFDIKPQVDAVSSPTLVNDLIQNDLLYNASSQVSSHTEKSEFDNSNKHYSDTTDWFQDSQWPFGASSATTMAASKDDDKFDEWNDFTSSTGNQGSFPDSWKQNSNENVIASEKISELNLFTSTTDPKEVDFGNFSQSDLFSGSSSNKNPNDTQEVYNIFSEVSTASRKNSNGEGGKKEDVEMVLSQMHDLSFMLKSELSVPSRPQGSS
ncbi:uncharacterized protein LOC112501449 isoform X2 [Cynara cardunculus var. scolymus]|uniref:uncharacterized protein LOC112501449 isoform X2 n=1 Tax=Cynara cardunculus var. scolymus TaxID=59895 RepID=UPI000D62A097|nr:uncharacterized protein LOC112501449 isoform X2 [Cynara cardunculus var. scolymus]